MSQSCLGVMKTPLIVIGDQNYYTVKRKGLVFLETPSNHLISVLCNREGISIPIVKMRKLIKRADTNRRNRGNKSLCSELTAALRAHEVSVGSGMLHSY